MSPSLLQVALASCIAIDFTLVGNAITQSFMTLPALIIDFPQQSSPDYASRASLLGRQWPVCWVMGNNFFRPISTLSTIGYAFTAWQLYRADLEERKDWRWFAFAAFLHLTVIVNSALFMQPLNAKLTALAGTTSDGKGKVAQDQKVDAVKTAKTWIYGNLYRVFVPFTAGSIAISQALF